MRGETEDIEEKKKKLLEAKNAEEQLKATLRVVLDHAAYSRLTNIRLVNPQLYLTAAQYVISLFKQSGKRVGEENLLRILKTLKESERAESIRFERK